MSRVSPYIIRQVRASMEKITVTTGEILAGFQAAGVAATAKCGPVIKLKLAEFKHATRHIGIPIQETLEDLKKDHAKKNTAGKPVLLRVQGTEIPGMYEYEDVEAYKSAEKDLLNQKREIEVPLFTREEIEKLGDFEGDIEGLWPFIKK